MIHGSHAPTHTVVVPSCSKRNGPTGSGFLFDEHWRLAARFTIGASEVMIGTCNGLLCFHDIVQQIIRIVEPFTGEAVTVPDPSHWYAVSYCFGFDATKGQYKIIRKLVTFHSYNANFVVSLSLFTIGVDKNWRTVSTAYGSGGARTCRGHDR
jgi:hypothetical protein